MTVKFLGLSAEDRIGLKILHCIMTALSFSRRQIADLEMKHSFMLDGCRITTTVEDWVDNLVEGS